MDEGRAVDVVKPDFTKAFDTVSHIILLQKVPAHGSDGHTLDCLKNRLGGHAQRVLVNGVKFSVVAGQKMCSSRLSIGATSV